MNKEKYNWTTSFALPLLGWIRSMYEPYLINAYIKHEGIVHFTEDHLFVLLKEGIDAKYKDLENTIINHKSHITQYYVDESEEYSMHVFKFVNELIPDYKLFLEGKYSKMSEGAKQLIKINSKSGGTNWKVLSKNPSLRKYQEERIGQSLDPEAEVWPTIFDSKRISKEVFTSELFEKIKSNS